MHLTVNQAPSGSGGSNPPLRTNSRFKKVRAKCLIAVQVRNLRERKIFNQFTMSNEFKPNIGKNLQIEISDQKWARFPIKTHVIIKGDNIVDVCKKYAAPYLQNGDILFISEKIVAISQGRAFPIKDIKPSPLANFW